MNALTLLLGLLEERNLLLSPGLELEEKEGWYCSHLAPIRENLSEERANVEGSRIKVRWSLNPTAVFEPLDLAMPTALILIEEVNTFLFLFKLFGLDLTEHFIKHVLIWYAIRCFQWLCKLAIHFLTMQTRKSSSQRIRNGPKVQN